MVEFAVLLVLGIAVIVMGIVTATGNLIFIKKRNKKNVNEYDRLLFGRLSGIACIIIGIGMVISSILIRVFENDDVVVFSLIPFIVVGGVLAIFASIKYNRR